MKRLPEKISSALTALQTKVKMKKWEAKLIRELKARCVEYEKHAQAVRLRGLNKLAANRYEGIGVGTRWALEDLQDAISSSKRK